MLISGEILLSKILEEKDLLTPTKLGFVREDLQLEVERKAYDFILKYNNDFGGIPDWRSTMASIPEFNFREECSDSFEYLVRELKKKRKSKEIESFMNRKIDEWGKGDVDTWTTSLEEGLKEINSRTSSNLKVGTSLVDDYEEYLKEYDSRKEGTSNRHFKSSFPTLNREIGGYISGNMYTFFARSGRGKSVVTSIEAINMAQFQGATVLIYALEMSKFEWLSRAYSFISANSQMVKQNLNGVDYLAGFKSNDMMRGELTEIEEKEFREFLANMNKYISGNIIIRGKSDNDFTDRSCSQLERDILNTKADVVIIDPVYLMDYESNTNKTTGGAATATSQRLNRIAGSTDTIIFAITQSDEDKKGSDDERELNVPDRSEVKKTSALLEDAFNLFAFDSCDARFQMSIRKGRQGGEGVCFEGVYLPAIGYVREPEREEVVKQFGAKSKKFEF